MKKDGVFHFIEDWVLANDLVDGIDFKIVSFLLEDDEGHLYSAHEYYHIDPIKELQQKIIQHIIHNEHDHITHTPYIVPERPLFFYKMKGHVNFAHAIPTGFGVVRMLRGPWEGEYLLYNYDPVFDGYVVEWDTLYELLLLKIYVQLTYPHEQDDRLLEKRIESDPMQLSQLLPGNAEVIFKELKAIYAKKKGKVYQF
ncbi:hypothetical protein EJF36_19160 [Bacillus sp. HMF5848]|uniref:hypothetical protein n=1 Tax=Bacillus sp. HMF5848 TaxID=2495421 RepID=UPI000F7AF4B4|nr:hypothetical protein [Bacillus sp. HMF5848]RSK28824.1 hypothetical protein EJF36_19160 [Bacillus sp. HMF5848]